MLWLISNTVFSMESPAVTHASFCPFGVSLFDLTKLTKCSSKDTNRWRSEVSPYTKWVLYVFITTIEPLPNPWTNNLKQKKTSLKITNWSNIFVALQGHSDISLCCQAQGLNSPSMPWKHSFIQPVIHLNYEKHIIFSPGADNDCRIITVNLEYLLNHI